jgi:hypothetical protein
VKFERWRQVIGFSAYEVSDKGRVRSLLSGLILKPWLLRGRYGVVSLRRNGATYKRMPHRLAAQAFGRLLPRSKKQIDYRRGVVATRAEILRGIGPKPHTSAYKGVSYVTRTGRWYACIRCRGRTRALGFFADEAAAAKVYDRAARAQWGACAYQNFGTAR